MPIKIIGLFFSALPVINYASAAYQNNRSIADICGNLESFSVTVWFFSIFPFFIGIGILTVREWGRQLLLIFAACLVLYNVLEFTVTLSMLVFVSDSMAHYIINPLLYNIIALLQIAFAAALLGYFLKKDVSTPYLSEHSRGWRAGPRGPLDVEVIVDGQSRRTTDLNERGCYVICPRRNYRLGDRAVLELKLDDEMFILKGGIARIDDAGVGVAFRDLKAHERERLRRALNSHNSRPGARGAREPKGGAYK